MFIGLRGRFRAYQRCGCSLTLNCHGNYDRIVASFGDEEGFFERLQWLEGG